MTRSSFLHCALVFLTRSILACVLVFGLAAAPAFRRLIRMAARAVP